MSDRRGASRYNESWPGDQHVVGSSRRSSDAAAYSPAARFPPAVRATLPSQFLVPGSQFSVPSRSDGRRHAGWWRPSRTGVSTPALALVKRLPISQLARPNPGRPPSDELRSGVRAAQTV